MKVSNEAGQGVREPGRQHGFEPQGQPAQPLGMPGHHEEERDARQRRDHGRDAAELDPRQLGGVADDDARAGRQHEEREQQQHDQQVEQPLEDDRGERGRGAELFAPGQHVRANDLSGPGRQQEARGEPDHGRAKRGAEPGLSERRQQILPAQRAERIGGQRRHQRQAPAEERRRGGFRPRRPADWRCGAKRPAVPA